MIKLPTIIDDMPTPADKAMAHSIFDRIIKARISTDVKPIIMTARVHESKLK